MPYHLGSCDSPPSMVFDIPFTGTTITTGNASTARNVVVSSRRWFWTKSNSSEPQH